MISAPPERITVGEAMRRAQVMADDWTVEEIRQYLADRDVSRSWHTIRRWCLPSLAEADRQRVLGIERRRWARKSGGRLGRRDQSVELQEYRAAMLLGQGMTQINVARVMDFDFPDRGWTYRRVRALDVEAVLS